MTLIVDTLDGTIDRVTDDRLLPRRHGPYRRISPFKRPLPSPGWEMERMKLIDAHDLRKCIELYRTMTVKTVAEFDLVQDILDLLDVAPAIDALVPEHDDVRPRCDGQLAIGESLP